MAFVNGQYIDDFEYNDMIDKALASGQNFAGNNFVGGTDFTGTTPGFLEQLGNTLGMQNGNILGMSQDQLSGLTGLAGTAYNIGSGLGLFGGQSDLLDAQTQLLKDKIDYNKEIMANKRAFNTNIGSGLAQAFGTKTA